MYNVKRFKYGYIPCPRCVWIGNKVKIHLCTIKCIRFLSNIGASDPFLKEIIKNAFRKKRIQDLRRVRLRRREYGVSI